MFTVSALQRVWLEDTKRVGGSSMVINLTNLDLLDKWLAMPGWRVNAVFEKDTCVGHVASAPGHDPVEIKNPGA